MPGQSLSRQRRFPLGTCIQDVPMLLYPLRPGSRGFSSVGVAGPFCMFRQFYTFSQLPLTDMPNQAEVKLTMRLLPTKVIFIRRVPFHFSKISFDFFEFALQEVR